MCKKESLTRGCRGFLYTHGDNFPLRSINYSTVTFLTLPALFSLANSALALAN